MENVLRAVFEAGRPTLSTRLISTKPYITELVGVTGLYDYVEFLAEYATFTQEDLENLARAAELHRMGTMIKVDFENRKYTAQKAVAAGFQSVLFTDHRTAAQVADTLSALRPDTVPDGGAFGFSTRRFQCAPPLVPVADHVRRLRRVVCAFMIEKKEALDNIEEICAVPGVDMVQFGPNDFCMSQGWEPAEHREELAAAEERMVEAALRHGVRPRCEINRPEQAARLAALGVRDFSLGMEPLILEEFWRTAGGQLRASLHGETK